MENKLLLESREILSKIFKDVGVDELNLTTDGFEGEINYNYFKAVFKENHFSTDPRKQLVIYGADFMSIKVMRQIFKDDTEDELFTTTVEDLILSLSRIQA